MRPRSIPKTVPDSAIFHFRQSTLHVEGGERKKKNYYHYLLSTCLRTRSNRRPWSSRRPTVEQELQGQVDAVTQRAIDTRCQSTPDDEKGLQPATGPVEGQPPSP
jgi:hypothetical protein